MIPPRFSRTIEDFTCLNCDARIVGDGFTNHCPRCLWSRHVDVNPGDRAAECRGAMEPIRVEAASADYVIIHRCRACGLERRQKCARNDDFEAILRVAGSAVPSRKPG